MSRFLARRVVTMAIAMVVVSMIVFLMARLAGDPRNLYLSQDASQEQYDALTKRFGFDKSLPEQYWLFVKGVAQGDLGESTRETRPVSELIWGPFWATLQLGGIAFLVSILLSVPMGLYSAVRRNSIATQGLKMFAMLGQSIPAFLLGIFLIFIFAADLGWVPAAGRGGWSSFILPVATAAWFNVAASMRLFRSSMLDVLDTEYVKLARAKGVSGRSVIWKHAIRNALIPLVTFWGVNLGVVITGSVVVEVVFAWPGMGRLALIAMTNGDYPLLQGVVLIFSASILIASLLSDVIYALIDPRIRHASF